MAKTVAAIMTRDLLSLRSDEPPRRAIEQLLRFGSTGAPVTDTRGGVVGHVSLRDLLVAQANSTLGELMASRPITVAPDHSIEEAGRKMAEYRVHRLIVVDDDSRLVGVVSAVDVISGLLEEPVEHGQGAAFHCQTKAGVARSFPDLYY
jgi:magnesium transporter